MLVGVLRLELILHAPHSLKEKRGLVKKLLGRCRNRFPVSAAETGGQDLWQRAELGFSMVSAEAALIEGVFRGIEDEIVGSGLADVIDSATEIIHF